MDIIHTRGVGKTTILEVFEFDKKISAKKICLSLMDEGILAKETHETVIRFAPPLTITKAEIDWAMEKIIKVFRGYQ